MREPTARHPQTAGRPARGVMALNDHETALRDPAVGYGDVVPVSQVGRTFAYVLMIGGIGLFGALTANFASIL